MTFPVLTRAALADHSIAAGNGSAYTDADECDGSKFHSPSPLVVHEVNLRDGSIAMLCGTCRDNLGVLWQLLDAHDGTLAWPVRREHGNRIRALALQGSGHDVQ